MKVKDTSSIINSVIGKGTKFSGQFFLSGYLRIDGWCSGRIQTDGKIFVSKSGKCFANILVRAIEISGELRGDIVATESVVIRSTAKVTGDIITPHLKIEDGGFYKGSCRANPEIDIKKEIVLFQKKQEESLNNIQDDNVIMFEKKSS